MICRFFVFFFFSISPSPNYIPKIERIAGISFTLLYNVGVFPEYVERAAMNENPGDNKLEVLKDFLKQEYVLVHLNPKGDGVVIPDHLASDASVTLKLSRYFRGNMELTGERVTADLLFGGSYFTCIIPIDAIWSCTSEDGQNPIWIQSAPPEVAKKVQAIAQEDAIERRDLFEARENSENGEKRLPRKGHLRRVK